MDDLEGAGISVVDADLLGRQPMLDQLVLDALVGERARGIKPERLQVAGRTSIAATPPASMASHELGPRREREIVAAPEAEALGIGEVVHGGGAGRGHVEDAGVGQRVLQAQPRAALAARGPCRRARTCRRRRSASHANSSKTMTPSKSRPNHSMICWTREAFASRSAERNVA